MNASMSLLGQRRAFTLQEIAVTLVVISIIAAIAIPTFATYIESTKRETAEASAANYVSQARAMKALVEQAKPGSTLQNTPEAWVEAGQDMPAGSFIEGVATPLPADATPTDLNGDDPGFPFLPISGGSISAPIDFGHGIDDVYYPVTMTVIGDDVTFESDGGQESPPAVPYAPDAPRSVSAARASDTSLQVTFQEPLSDGGASITRYDVACVSSDGGDAGDSNGLATTLTVTGLTTGKTYTCTATATNGVGTSPASTISASVKLSVVADAPTGLAAEPTSAGDDRLVFTWNEVEPTAAKPVDGYVILKLNEATDLYEVAALVPGASTETYTLTGLTPGATGTFTIATMNDIGEGPRASSIEATPIGAPAAPSITSTGYGDQSLSITWSTSPTAAAPVESLVVYRDGTEVATLAGNATTYSFTGLTAGTEYGLSVVAVNDVGQSAQAQASTTATAISVLGAVTWGLPATVVGSTSVTLNWDAKEPTAQLPVTGYAVYKLNSSTAIYDLVSLVPGASSDSYEVTGLTTGTSYEFQVAAYNAAGEGARSTTQIATPIDAPNNATITDTALQIEAATIEWTATSTASQPITEYRLYQDGALVETVADDVSEFQFTGLTAGSTYEFEVRPANARGEVSPVASSARVSMTAVNVPLQVTWATPATSVTDTSVTLNWEPLAESSATPVTGYAVYRLNTSTGLYDVEALVPGRTSSTYTVSGLVSGEEYSFEVAAYNTAGEGLRSAVRSATTITVPNAPSVTSVTSASATSLAVAWTSTITASTPVDYYTVECTSSDGGATGNTSDASSPATVGSLTNGKTYTCVVTATNSQGSTASSESDSVLLATAPGAPTSLTTRLTSASAVDVTFVAPANNGGATITGYTVTCTSADGGTTRTGTGAGLTVAVSNLSDGNNYTCTATATNSAGTSAASAASAEFTAGEAAYSTQLAYEDAERIANELESSMG